jgi:hypothetical protein
MQLFVALADSSREMSRDELGTSHGASVYLG